MKKNGKTIKEKYWTWNGVRIMILGEYGEDLVRIQIPYTNKTLRAIYVVHKNSLKEVVK